MTTWTFFTNYGHVLFLIGENPKLTLREIAGKVGITERATQKIIHDLDADGFIKIGKQGRRNVYKIMGKKRLRHEIEKSCRVESLIELIGQKN